MENCALYPSMSYNACTISKIARQNAREMHELSCVVLHVVMHKLCTKLRIKLCANLSPSLNANLSPFLHGILHWICTETTCLNKSFHTYYI